MGNTLHPNKDDFLAVQQRNKDKIKEKKKKSSSEELIISTKKDENGVVDIRNQFKIVKNEMLKKYAQAWTNLEVKAWLKELGYASKSAENIINHFRKEINKEIEKNKAAFINQNIVILQTIAKNSIEDKKYRDAIAAITELNRVLHAYDVKTEVNISNYGFSFDMGVGEQQPMQVVEIKDPDIEEIEPEEDE